MIRRAVMEDMTALVRMARRFHSLTDYALLVPFHLESFEKSIHNFLQSETTIVYVADDGAGAYGMGAAIAYPQWWNHAHLTGQELFWWIDEDHRGGSAAIKLFRALERWAQETGCKTFSMIHTPNLAPDSLRAFYLKSGYRQWDHFYTREF